MYTYLVLKTLHIFGAMLFLGTGFGSAWYRLRADFSDDARIITWVQQEIVRADWYFTVPAGLIMPLTGVGLIHTLHLGWTTPWIVAGFLGYCTAGIFWLPAVWLQIRMRKLAEEALAGGTKVPTEFHRYARWWAALGVPSFGASVFTVWVMVAKHVAIG